MTIIKVKYIENYILEVSFGNGVTKKLDFEKYLTTSDSPLDNQYLDKKLFSKVRVDDGNLYWNNDMDFPVDYLYRCKGYVPRANNLRRFTIVKKITHRRATLNKGDVLAMGKWDGKKKSIMVIPKIGEMKKFFIINSSDIEKAWKSIQSQNV